MKTLSNCIIWGGFVFGVLPLARILVKQRYPSRGRYPSRRPGAHAKTSEDSEVSGPEASRKLWYAARLAAVSVLAAFNFIFHPHGLVDWMAIGIVVVILLWEPAIWLTAYLVRRSNSQDSA